MAKVIALDPAVIVTVGNIEIVATEAVRGARGLSATVMARNGRPLVTREVKLAKPADRTAYAREVSAAGHVEADQVEAALLQLHEGIEGATRNQSSASGGNGGSGGNQATVMTAMAASAELFRSPGGQAYATVPVDGHRATYKVKSSSFKLWLRGAYYRELNKAPGAQAVQDALNTLEAQAMFGAAEHPVYTRVAEHAGGVVIDLGGPDWSVVVVREGDWSVVQDSPVKFRRANSMAALPTPVPGGQVADLRRFINVASDDDFALALGWLVAAFREQGPKPLLVLNGEQGSAKSTLARMLRRLIDPNSSPLRAGPRNEHELMISAGNSWVLNFDNLSYIEPWLSDALCRLSTGGGLSARELYTDEDEVLFDARRPVIINGIDELATRSDLLDRAILLNLPVIPDDRRQSEAELWDAFDREYPRLFGALLDAVAVALRRERDVRLTSAPRLADFARWVVAAEPALGLSVGQFLAAYTANRGAAHELAVEASVIAPWLVRLVAAENFSGTATDLLRRLNSLARMELGVTQQRGWPRVAKTLSDQIRRLAPNLPAVGITVNFDRTPDSARTRIITIRNTARTVGSRNQTNGAGTQSTAPAGQQTLLRPAPIRRRDDVT